MSSDRSRLLVIGCIGVLVVGIVFSVGILLGFALPQLRGQANPISTLSAITQPEIEAPAPPTDTLVSPTTTEDLTELFAPFWESWDIVHEQFVDQPIDDVALMQGAIQGMLDSLDDPYTSYMDPDEYMQANFPLDGEYEGIGAWVDTDAEYLTIISPMPGSPAEEVGLLPGDEVIAVDGDDMTGVDGNLVVRRVLGPAGTTVRLTIRREGLSEPFDVEIVRARIELPSVESELLEEGIGYIRLYNFGAQTTGDLRRALEDLLSEDPTGLILDLRGNGGGFLNTAVEVTSEFIDDGIVLIERHGDGTEDIFRTNSNGTATDLPLVVLIDGGSASASEIVAGAIQDNQRGLLIGEQSFGKGSVQNWVPLSDNQGAVRVTIARWYTPADRQINEVGLTPDIEVLVDPEQVDPEQDPQLDKAIEVLMESIGLD
jgi:carboxyl-terminal processing protease